MQNVLIWLHVSGNLVWIGSILAVAILLAGKDGDPKTRGALARRVYLMLSTPAFGLSFLAGSIRTAMDLKNYFVLHHWMHGKLLFALIVIGIHHVLGARAKRMASGTVQDGGPSGMLGGVLAVSAVLAALFVILRIPD